MVTHLAFWMPGMMETVVLLIVGLVLFGGNLPEVGKSVGRSLIEFRKGLRDLKTSTGLDEVARVKDEILGMAREVDPRRMMDMDDADLPDDPYADLYQEGEYSEVETSKPGADSDTGPSDAEPSGAGSSGAGSSEATPADADPDAPHKAPATDAPRETQSVAEDDDGSIGEADYVPPKREDSGRLEGSQREPHEEDDPPTFGYDRHG